MEQQRRTDRDEGFRLLFGAAQDLARQQNKLANRVAASLEHSSLERGMFKLRNTRNRLITAIPIQNVRDMLAYRRELARDVMQMAGVDLNHSNPASLERPKVRIQTPEVRALAWAISDGRRIPYRRRRHREPLIAVALLLCGFVPGLIYLMCIYKQKIVYAEELKKLEQRWREQGMPEPSSSFFQLYGQ